MSCSPEGATRAGPGSVDLSVHVQWGKLREELGPPLRVKVLPASMTVFHFARPTYTETSVGNSSQVQIERKGGRGNVCVCHRMGHLRHSVPGRAGCAGWRGYAAVRLLPGGGGMITPIGLLDGGCRIHTCHTIAPSEIVRTSVAT